MARKLLNFLLERADGFLAGYKLGTRAADYSSLKLLASEAAARWLLSLLGRG